MCHFVILLILANLGIFQRLVSLGINLTEQDLITFMSACVISIQENIKQSDTNGV